MALPTVVNLGKAFAALPASLNLATAAIAIWSADIAYATDLAKRRYPGQSEITQQTRTALAEAVASLRSRKAQRILLVPKPFTGAQVATALDQLLAPDEANSSS